MDLAPATNTGVNSVPAAASGGGAGDGFFARAFEPWFQLRAALTAGGLLLVGFLLEWAGGLEWGRWLVWASLAIGMVYGVKAAAEALREKKVDIDVLMVLGAGLAAGVGHPEEGALLLFLFILSGAMEDLAMERTKREVEALHGLMPKEALVQRDGEWVSVDPGAVAQGERIRLRAGDVIPVDAEIALGTSSIDQSTLTGEPMPRDVREGEEIYAGTVNLSGVIEARALRPASESSLQRVLNMVMAARSQREPVQRIIDRLSQPYTIIVLIASVATLLAWWLVFRDPLVDAAYTAITLLIVMSPCALIIATPTVTLAAIARGARAGVLFKGGHAIDALSRVGAVCFDKTGTLTLGGPRIVDFYPVAWSSPEEMLGLAAGIEADSTHPIARAVRTFAESRGVAAAAVGNVQLASGKGLVGALQGDEVRLGSFRHVEPIVPVCLRAHTRESLAHAQRTGRIAVVVARGGERGGAAVLAMADPLRPSARAAVRALHDEGVRPVRMLTGDARDTAEIVAREAGVDGWDAELFPEQKVEVVGQMRAAAKRGRERRSGVAFVGDGVNDAPALAAADVGVAIGSIGSGAALESADMVMMGENLLAVPWAIGLSRRARGILRFNITLALTVIIGMGAVVLVGSRTGWRPPLSAGVLAHEGGTILVVMNALRLLWARGFAREDRLAEGSGAEADDARRRRPGPARIGQAAAAA